MPDLHEKTFNRPFSRRSFSFMWADPPRVHFTIVFAMIASSMDITKKKILWIEDDKLLGAIVSEKFASSQCELVLVKTGAEAFSALERFTPDAIVVDLLLPNGMNGFDILKKI